MSTLVLAEFFLPTIGGSINWLVNTYSRYPSNEVVVMAPMYNDQTFTDGSLSFPVIRLHSTYPSWDASPQKFLFDYVRVMRQVWNVCRQYRVDQIHCAKVLPEGLLAWGLKMLLGLPYFIYAHGEEIKICQTSRLLSWVMPRIYNDATAIIANSRNTKSLLESVGVRSDVIHIIHPGVDSNGLRRGEKLAGDIRRRYGLGSCPVLLIVGRLQRRKGHDMLIHALPNIQCHFPEVKCLVVGSGEEEAYLKNLAQEVGVRDRVIFAGRVPDAELGSFYAACDIFVMPNRQIGADIEGFGMVYLEAASLGKPVVGGKSGGTDDAIVDGITGLRVDGSRPEEIANVVIALLSNPEKATAMGENGRRRVDAKFTWEFVYEQTRQLTSGIHAAE